MKNNELINYLNGLKLNLQQQLVDIQTDIDKLERHTKKSLLSKPKVGEDWHRVIGNSASKGFDWEYGTTTGYYVLHNTAFAEPYAKDYAKAFNTFFALRHCEGSEPAVDDKYQWYIYHENGLLRATRTEYLNTKINRQRVFFRNEASATSAIKTVGEDNIIHMMKTFSGVFEQ